VALNDKIASESGSVTYQVKGRFAKPALSKSMFPHNTFQWWLKADGRNASSSGRALVKTGQTPAGCMRRCQGLYLAGLDEPARKFRY
jgi:hypothetical protein